MKDDRHSYYAVGSALYEEDHPVARLLANSAAWLIQQRNDDGTWGSQDALDRFISTTHSAMTLLAIGFSPDSELVKPAIDYLVGIDTETQVTFFYRSGVLLNLGAYQSIVRKDAEFLWNYRRRIGGAHKDYPTLYFLLKLLKFAEPPLDTDFDKSVVVREVIEEWNEEECWYGRTSLTSMALALIYDENFQNKGHIISRSKAFLEGHFVEESTSQGHFNPNIVDDSFTVYNLCERNLLDRPENEKLSSQTARAAARLVSSAVDNAYWESSPPFGGSVGRRIYPTAVAIRAILSFYVGEIPNLRIQVSSGLLDKRISDFMANTIPSLTAIRPFWGEFTLRTDSDFCFVLMPFKPIELTEIYEKYIKDPIESNTGLRCLRADDIHKSTQIMLDVWRKIGEAKFVIADMTGQNANVFYELGLAHTIGKEVILVSQSQKEFPFDLTSVRTIIYKNRLSGYEYLKESLLKYVRELVD